MQIESQFELEVYQAKDFLEVCQSQRMKMTKVEIFNLQSTETKLQQNGDEKVKIRFEGGSCCYNLKYINFIVLTSDFP